MIWVEVTSFLTVGDLCCHGYKHLVKFREKTMVVVKKKTNDCWLETENKLLSPLLKSDVLLSKLVSRTPPSALFMAL